MPISFSDLGGGGGGGGGGFNLVVGSSGNSTFQFSAPQPVGPYSFTSQLNDTNFDIYLITADNQNAGYANAGSSLVASAEFDRVVVYGATPNDIITFEAKESVSPATSGDVVDGAAPFLTSAFPASDLSSVDDTTTVTGGNFATDVEIVFTGQDDVDRPAKSIVRSSSTSLIVTRPDVFPLEQEPFTMTATNAGITNPTSNVNKLVDYFTVSSPIEYLVVAGGGSRGFFYGAAGGGGGYRSSVVGEASGGGTGAEPIFSAFLSTNYTVTVGAGGASTSAQGNNGSPSTFATITSLGGGGGGGGTQNNTGNSGGSGGGGQVAGGAGTAGQGFAGRVSGGGGAGALGKLDGVSTGGEGVISSITGTAVMRAAGGFSSSAVYAANLGTGSGQSEGSAGQSGVVILRYPSALTISVGAGLTANTATLGDKKVTTFTAGTGTVSWS